MDGPDRLFGRNSSLCHASFMKANLCGISVVDLRMALGIFRLQ